jgi:hypothetical protein
MQTSDALAIVAELPVDAFYVPGHKLVAEVLEHAHRHGWRPDRTLIVDELDRIGLLEEAGGAHAVFELWSRTVATGNARRNADRLLDLRRERLERIGIEELRARIAEGLVDDLASDLRRFADELEHGNADRLPTVDLTAALNGELPQPTILHRADGQALLYTGAVNYLFGEPGKGKSWVAQIAAKDALDRGDRVVYLDFEANARGVVSRLLALGATTTAILDRFIYAADPASPRTPALTVAEVHAGAALVIVDGIAAAMSAADLDEDNNGDVNVMWDRLLVPPAAAGATVIGVDHVTKSKEGRGLWPRGGGSKRARIDGAAYLVEVTEPFNRHKAGRIRLTLAKDREGGTGIAEASTAASIYVNPRLAGERIDVTIDAPLPELEDDEAPRRRPSDEAIRLELLDKVPRALDKAGALNKGDLAARLRAHPLKVRFDNRALEPVLVELEDSGQIVRDNGKHGAKVFALAPRQLGLEDPA